MIKILLIEDSEQLREYIADILMMEGFEVILATDGEEGVSLAVMHQPDLILCDIMMPGKDGYEVFQILNSHERLVAVPFIFITALSERTNYRQGMDLGADDYLVKPFTIEELLRSINSRLKKRRSIEKSFKVQLDEIETSLKKKLEDVNSLSSQAMDDDLRFIELNTKLQYLEKQITEEIKKNRINEKGKLFLINLRNKIKNSPVVIDNWTIFQMKFNQAYPNLAAILVSRFSQLTQQDLIILSALYMNMNTYQLSVILGISPDSVRKSKYRLKKKLGLSIDQNLIHYIRNIIHESKPDH